MKKRLFDEHDGELIVFSEISWFWSFRQLKEWDVSREWNGNERIFTSHRSCCRFLRIRSPIVENMNDNEVFDWLYRVDRVVSGLAMDERLIHRMILNGYYLN